MWYNIKQALKLEIQKLKKIKDEKAPFFKIIDEY
jgi:hypothetical protein